MLEFAVKRKLIAANPAKGVPLLKVEKKERFLSKAEVKRLDEAVLGMEAERKLSSTAAVAIWLLMLTGCRKSEILSLRWEWVDFERSCLRLPESKTGAKGGTFGVVGDEAPERPSARGYVRVTRRQRHRPLHWLAEGLGARAGPGRASGIAAT